MKNSNISKERKKYLHDIKKEKFLVLLTQILTLVIIIAVWETLANRNVIDSFITSQPSRILNTLLHLGSNDLVHHILVTVYETVMGFFFRYNTRNYCCYYIVVVRFFKKSCRAISSCFK